MSGVVFQRTIGESEARLHYLNLTDDNGVTYGRNFPPSKTPLWILTEGKRNKASKHGRNQIWGSVRSWFYEFEIQSGDEIKITYDKEAELIEGRVPIEIGIIKRADSDTVDEVIDRYDEDYSAVVTVQMEEDLEDFLVENLNLLESGLELYAAEDGRSGRQFKTPIGTIDLLCTKDDIFTVVELKKGRSGDRVVGQISRYIGWVKENLADQNNPHVKGIIIVHDFDSRLKYAVAAHDNLELKYYRIQIDFISEDAARERSGIDE